MNFSEIIDLIVEDLKKCAAIKHNTLGVPGFTTNMERFGVSSPQIKKLVSQWSNVLFDFTPQQWIELCMQLTQRGIFEAQILAYELLWRNKKALKYLNQNQVLELGYNLDNWVSVDSYSTMIAGWHWREGSLSDTQIFSWLKSDNHWLRRVAVVSTISLNQKSKGGTGDSKRTLMVCGKVVADRDDLVVKALSWALRELSKTDRQAVSGFVEKYHTQLHPRVVREVKAKLETGRKNG